MIKNKKILIVTHWYYPRNVPRAFRAKELVEHLRKRGYSVDVLIGDYKKKVKHNNHESYDEKFTINENKLSSLSHNFLIDKVKKIFNYFFGERFVIKSGRFIYKELKNESYDSVISIGLPFYVNFITSLYARRMKREMKNMVFIADWSDPYYGGKDVKVAPYFYFLQKFACKHLDYNVIPTEAALSYYLEYTESDKLKVIPQGFDFNKIKIFNYKKNVIPQLAYAGIFYDKIRNPSNFLRILSEIEQDFTLTLYTITHGPIYKEVLCKYKEILGEKLVIKNLIAREECIFELSKMDFLVNLENETSNQIPSKLIDYTLAKRPILSFRQDEITQAKILQFLSGDYSESLKLDISDHNIEKVGDKFINLIEGEGN